jgi:hypothetical protein
MTPSGFANQVASQEDSPATFGPPAQSSLNLKCYLISIMKDEYAQFLAHKRASSSSTATLAQLDTASHCLLSSTSNPRVIDSDTNKRMVGSSTSLSYYHSVDTPRSVTLANGSLSQVAGSGTTHLSPDIELLFVLHVPSFPFNLLSISKITKALNCSVSFYPSLCSWGMKLVDYIIWTSHLHLPLALCSRWPPLFNGIVVLVILLFLR